MKPTTGRQSFLAALANAGQGVWHGIKNERNVQIDAVCAVLTVVLGFAFQISATQWLAVVICIGLVLALELINTAIEAVVDLASPEYHELARIAKDCAAGACLIASICAFIVGVIIFLPYILQLLS